MSADILDRLLVWSGQRVAGDLAIDRGGAMHFTYASEWLSDLAAAPLKDVSGESFARFAQDAGLALPFLRWWVAAAGAAIQAATNGGFKVPEFIDRERFGDLRKMLHDRHSMCPVAGTLLSSRAD